MANETYQYRNLPCNVVPDDLLWTISGTDTLTGGSGVLEWCLNEPDARWLMAEMEAFLEQFSKLTAAPYNDLPALKSISDLIEDSWADEAECPNVDFPQKKSNTELIMDSILDQQD